MTINPPAEHKLTRALVLAGGGVSGVAWELGLLTALARAGTDFSQVDLVVGTSAGSVVGTQLTTGADLEKVFATQLAPVAQSLEKTVDFDINQFQQMIMEQVKQHGMNAQAVRAGIGQKALAAQTVAEEERKAIIAARLPVHQWPAQRLLITAVEAQSGDWVVFDQNSGVNLVEAVAASCAVPLVWPTVTINGHSYMDGGMRSGTNADLAVGYDRVLVLVPLPQPPNIPPVLGSNLEVEKALLEKQGSQVLIIAADEAAIKAMGANVLDPANRAASAQAGLAQGAALAQVVRQFWFEMAD